MNTKLILTATALLLGVTGIICTFAPELLLVGSGIEITPTSLVLGQVTGGLYFGYGMLNWMVKGSLTGGIYNRPVVIANFAHFMIAGLALAKGVLSNPEATQVLFVAAIIYLLLASLFGILLFKSPIK